MLKCYEKYHLDVLSVCPDSMREAEGLGASVTIPDDDVPFSPSHFLNDITDIHKLKVVDPSLSRRMNDRLEAIHFLKERVHKEVPVVGWVEGAVAESCDLMDMSTFMCEMLDESDAVHELLSICCEQSKQFALAQLNAGADIIGIGDAASSLIGPALYEEFALPYQKQLISEIQKAGGKVKLHICGDLNPVLHLVAQTNADIIDLDHMVDINRASELFPKSSCIDGNFDPVQVLLQGTPQIVKESVEKCLSISKVNNNMIAAGCEVPKHTSMENLMAVYETLCQWKNK